MVSGSLIGTDVTGEAALPNANGVQIPAGAANNTIGGTASGARNVISGNSNFGVVINPGSSNNMLAGNYVGTDASGIRALKNDGDGIVVYGLDNVIGVPGAGNVISGNA